MYDVPLYVPICPLCPICLMRTSMPMYVLYVPYVPYACNVRYARLSGADSYTFVT